MIPGLWTPENGLPPGARAGQWLRDHRARERDRWRHVRDPRFDYLCVAPTLVSYTQVVFNTGGASKATGSISWQAGDILVTIAGSEGTANTFGTPTATGLTFAIIQAVNTGSVCGSSMAVATAASTSSAVVTVPYGIISGPPHWGFGVWVWRGSTGVGNSIEQHTATKTKALTITSANSGVCCGVFDFSAGAAGSGLPSVSNTRQSAVDAGRYSQLLFDNIDYSTSGSSWGESGGSASGPFSLLAVEILNTGGGGGGSTVTYPDFEMTNRGSNRGRNVGIG